VPFTAYDTLKAERDAAVQRLAAVERDAERLDWLEQHPHAVPYLHDRSGFKVNDYRTGEHRADTLRAAIDAALTPTRQTAGGEG
jgi:hypothetical protein